VPLLICTRLSLPQLCNLSHDEKTNERGRSTRRLPFHSEEKRRAVRKKRRTREKCNRWTKGSRLLISNVSDYVGLGSLRFFIQTKKGGEERSERGMRPDSLPRDCPIRPSFVSFSSGFLDVLMFLVVPFSSSRPCSLFIILYYFVFCALRRAEWRRRRPLRGTGSRLHSISWGLSAWSSNR